MKVLIVAKTHMFDRACVGAMVYDTGQSIRLLQPDCSNQPEDTPFNVGQVWDLEFRKRPNPIPPHVEDVLVLQQRYLGIQQNLAIFLRRKIKPWVGGPSVLYQGLLRFTPSGSGYISREVGIPGCNTGYWIQIVRSDGSRPPRTKHVIGTKAIRRLSASPTSASNRLSMLYQQAPSFASHWRDGGLENSEVEERCYLQLSGWYN